jgi:hypothetical protein
MAEKKARTAEKAGEVQHKHLCKSCGATAKVTLFTGFGRKGFFAVCEKQCGYVGRLR